MDASGWVHAPQSDFDGATAVPEAELQNTTKAATYLTKNYEKHYWKKQF
jgi:hypothetical protein